MSARLTIGLPVHNGAGHLEETLDAIVAQDYEDFELLISDNASTDTTGDICLAYARREPRISYHRHPTNLGAAPNYNFLVERARGELFKWASHDDLLAPGFLARCVEALDRGGEGVVLAFPQTSFIGADGERLGDWLHRPPRPGARPHERLRALLDAGEASLITICSAVFGVIRTSALRRTGLIRAFSGSDRTLIVELALAGEIAMVDEHLFLRRWHEGISTKANANDAEIQRWFDSRSRRTFLVPRTRVCASWVAVVWRTPVGGWTETAACLEELARWFWRSGEWRVVGGEWKIALGERVVARMERP